MGNSYRIDRIYNLLLQRNSATVNELAQYFHVTPTTIRRDLLELEDRKLIFRNRGSAFLLGDGEAEANVFLDEKKRIAAMAAKYISNGMSVSIDTGSTISALCDYLVTDSVLNNLDFVTSSPGNALRICKKFNVSIPGGSIPGGSQVPSSEFMVGLEVEEFFKKINVDVAFLSSTGVYNCAGLTVSYPLQLPVKKYSALCADKRIALLDSSKFSRRGIYVFCDFKDVDTLITVKTDSNAEQLDRIAGMGTEIVLV